MCASTICATRVRGIDLADVRGRVLHGDVKAAHSSAGGSRVPHTGMRRTIARRLSESKQQVPHFYLTVDCRMDALLALRAQAKQGRPLKLSVNDFLVRAADLKPLSAIAAEITELTERAKVNRLQPAEFTGGSLTVSNLGMYGIREFSAIINPPQAAILAVGAAEKRPVVNENGELSVATLMTVTLSADHRAVDGAVGARWLSAFRELIENPVRILL